MRLSATWTDDGVTYGVQVHDERIVYVVRDSAGRPATHVVDADQLASVDYSAGRATPVISLVTKAGMTTSFPCPRRIARTVFPAMKWLTVATPDDAAPED